MILHILLFQLPKHWGMVNPQGHGIKIGYGLGRNFWRTHSLYVPFLFYIKSYATPEVSKLVSNMYIGYINLFVVTKRRCGHMSKILGPTTYFLT